MLIDKKTGHVLCKASILTGFSLCMTSIYPAQAQVESATTTANPARVEQELLEINRLPDLSKKVDVENVVMQDAPEGAENITFQLNTLQIEGVGVYDAKDLDPLYRDKLGTTVSLADIYALARKITNKYRNDGYIITQVIVPPQTIEDGFVKLRAVEGFVDKVFIEGENSESEKVQIQKYADRLRVDNILDAKKLERYLLLINDLPGVTARSVLSPSRTTTGASDLTIIVTRDRYEGTVGFDNHGSRFLGPYQGIARGSANSMLGHNERISGQFVVAGDKNRTDELVFGSIAYEQVIDSFGSVLRLIGSVTSTEPGDVLDDFNVQGTSRFLSATLSRPFIRSRTTNFYGRASVDVRNVDSRNDIEPSREDKIRSIRLGATFQFLDTLIGVGANALDFEFSQGIDGLGSSKSGDPELTRAAGDPAYTKMRVQAQRLQRVTPKLNLLLAAEGQLASSPLLSSEEFGVGGLNIGRGYDSSEIVGDDGLAGKIELQWNEPYKVTYLDDYQLFGFFDIGTVWDQDATTSGSKRESLSSTGLGVRADITKATTAGLGVALPLTRRVDAPNDHDPRYYFSLTHSF